MPYMKYAVLIISSVTLYKTFELNGIHMNFVHGLHVIWCTYGNIETICGFVVKQLHEHGILK
jgi:hypothetical protein